MATHKVGHQEVLPCTAALILSTVSFFFISESYASPYYKQASSRESLEPKILEYVDYFERPTISSPLKKFLDRPRVLYTLAKAAEFAVDRHSIKTQRPYRLRQIIGLKELHNNTAFWYHVVLEDGKSLKEAFFDVVIPHTSSLEKKEFDSSEFRFGEFEYSEALEEKCDELSSRANCTCGYLGRCDRGTAEISAWLAFALKTQREIQLDTPFDQIQMVSAHNAFNDRANGYGILDDCPWPPPYKHTCLDLANQEFSFTDLLDMGVRGIEIDPWWCFDKMLMSHDDDKPYRGCAPWDRKFEDGIKEIGEWVHKPENMHEIVRLYFEDGATHTFGHDDLINGPIAEYLGDKVLTPNESAKYFPGRWPTARELRKLQKSVVIAAGGDNHGGEFIFDLYWNGLTRNEFVSHANCSAIKQNTPSRVYCDSTEYIFFWDGPKETGVILDFSRFMKCGVTYPAADQVNPVLLATAVFTWAEGEPSKALTEQSCVFLNGKTERWYVGDCQQAHRFACQSTMTANDWMISNTTGVYTKAVCPDGYEFSIPHNGLEHQTLVNVMNGKNTWINITPYIYLLA